MERRQAGVVNPREVWLQLPTLTSTAVICFNLKHIYKTICYLNFRENRYD